MKARNGQVAVYLALVLVAVCVLAVMNVGVFLSVRAKNRAMNAGDAAALAVAQYQGELLNRIGALNIDHLKAAIDNKEEECWEIPKEQARLCFLEPLGGISVGNRLAQANGTEPSREMREILWQHITDVRTVYAANPESYPAPWEGAWEEYAQRLTMELGQELYAGPDNIEFLDALGGHILLNPQFYNAIGGRCWCWFHFNAPSLLGSYSSYADWGPLPSPNDEMRRRRCANSEVYSLRLQPKVGSALDFLGTNLVMRLAEASLADIENSYMITNRNQTWYFYDENRWRTWWEMDPDATEGLPVVGKPKAEYDVRGCAAICRILQPKRSVVCDDGDRVVEWSAAAKPFGTVENEDGEIDVVTALKGFVVPSFAEARLVPIDAVGGKYLQTADPDWMRHVREHLPLYTVGGLEGLDAACWYCEQLRLWERKSFREEGILWLKFNAGSCVRSTGPGTARGGTSHGH